MNIHVHTTIHLSVHIHIPTHLLAIKILGRWREELKFEKKQQEKKSIALKSMDMPVMMYLTVQQII